MIESRFFDIPFVRTRKNFHQRVTGNCSEVKNEITPQFTQIAVKSQHTDDNLLDTLAYGRAFLLRKVDCDY